MHLIFMACLMLLVFAARGAGRRISTGAKLLVLERRWHCASGKGFWRLIWLVVGSFAIKCLQCLVCTGEH